MSHPHVKWSYSALSSFEKCPRQYNETRVKRSYEVSSPAIDLGNKIHKYFEDRVKDGTPFPPEWAHYEKIIAGFLTLPGTPYAELQVKIDETGKPAQGGKWDYWVTAFLDLCIINEEARSAFIIDWKTGNSKYADTQQLKLCALLLFACYPNIDTVKSALLFVKDGLPVEAYFERSNILEYWEHFMPGYLRLRTARATDVFNAKPSALCSVCPVKTCEHYRGK